MANQKNVTSLYVYSRICPIHFSSITWVLIGGAGFVIALMSLLEKDNQWITYVGLLLLLVSISRFLFRRIIILTSYSTYKNFKSLLDFDLSGWETIPIEAGVLNSDHWAINCSIEIDIRENNNPLNLNIISDALVIFKENANSRFYSGSHGADARKKWNLDGPLKISGSASRLVIGDIYEIIQVYLKAIHKESRIIKKVTIDWGDTVEYIKFKKPVR